MRLKPGIEFGTEIDGENGVWFRPSVRLGLNGLLSGDRTILSTEFDGAPAGITPFQVSTRTDNLLGEVNAGFELADDKGLSAKFGYFGQFGSSTTQQGLSLKVTLPF